MLRARRPRQILHLLALLAVSLLLAAPLLSRWQQAAPALLAAQPMCTERGPAVRALPGLAAVAPPGHAGPHAGEGRLAGGADSARHSPADHAGAACDYCLLAARLLPGLALLFVLLAAPCPARPPVGPVRAARAAPRWPAHAARGPPLAA